MDLLKLNDAGVTPEAFWYFNDFFRVDDATDDGAFAFDAIASGTLAVKSASGGWIRIAGVDDTDNSGGQIQAKGAFNCVTAKYLNFKLRALLTQDGDSTTVAAESDLLLGLFPVDTSLEASVPVDGIYFIKDEGATTIKCQVRTNNATPVYDQTITNVMDTSVHTYGIAVRPNGSSSEVDFLIDGVVVARARGISLPADTILLTPGLAFQSGDATGQKFFDIDYLGAYQQR